MELQTSIDSQSRQLLNLHRFFAPSRLLRAFA